MIPIVNMLGYLALCLRHQSNVELRWPQKSMCLLQPVKKLLCTEFAGFTIARLHKAVLTGGDERKQASQSAKLTLEDIQAKTGCLGEAQAFMYIMNCKWSLSCSLW